MIHWTLPGADNQVIHGSTHVPAGEVRGSLILAHGFKGYKDYGFFPWLAEQAATAGLVAVRFNFSHSGVDADPATFARPDLFERDTWTKQVFDMLALAGAVSSGKLPGTEKAANLPMIWFGHSRGGVTALLAARHAFEDPQQPARPAGIVTAGAPSWACNLDQQHRKLLRRNGYLDSPSSRTGQLLRIGVNWLDDIERRGDAVEPCTAIARVNCPVLLIHGDADETVGLHAAHALLDASAGRAELRVLPGATHVFNAPNPMNHEAPPETRQLAKLTLNFALDCIDGSGSA